MDVSKFDPRKPSPGIFAFLSTQEPDFELREYLSEEMKEEDTTNNLNDNSVLKNNNDIIKYNVDPVKSGFVKCSFSGVGTDDPGSWELFKTTKDFFKNDCDGTLVEGVPVTKRNTHLHDTWFKTEFVSMVVQPTAYRFRFTFYCVVFCLDFCGLFLCVKKRLRERGAHTYTHMHTKNNTKKVLNVIVWYCK